MVRIAMHPNQRRHPKLTQMQAPILSHAWFPLHTLFDIFLHPLLHHTNSQTLRFAQRDLTHACTHSQQTNQLTPPLNQKNGPRGLANGLKIRRQIQDRRSRNTCQRYLNVYVYIYTYVCLCRWQHMQSNTYIKSP